MADQLTKHRNFSVMIYEAYIKDIGGNQELGAPDVEIIWFLT